MVSGKAGKSLVQARSLMVAKNEREKHGRWQWLSQEEISFLYDILTQPLGYIETLQAVQQYDSNHDQNAEGQHLCGDDGPEDVPSPDDK